MNKREIKERFANNKDNLYISFFKSNAYLRSKALNFLELYHDIQIPSQTRLITHAPQFLPSHFQQQASQFYYYYRYIQRGNRVHAHRVL